MQLFYNSSLVKSSTEIVFDKEESRHITKVLRKTEGDILTITNGKGLWVTSKILLANVKQCVASVISSEKKAPLPYTLHMVVSPTKLNDRYEWFLEKATEIGVTQITPIICDHSERRVIKQERYEKVLQSAMKQSLSSYLPILNPVTTFNKFIGNLDDKLVEKYIAHCGDGSKYHLKSEVKAKQDVLILIGPEGDFSQTEIELATTNGFRPITLGNTRLRTETAAIVACHSIVFLNEI